MSSILLLLCHMLTVHHTLAGGTLYGDTDRIESNTTLTQHAGVFGVPSLSCLAHGCFRDSLCCVNISQSKGAACITSLVSPPTLRLRALRIKAVQIRAACHESALGAGTPPMLGDRGGKKCRCTLIP